TACRAATRNCRRSTGGSLAQLYRIYPVRQPDATHSRQTVSGSPILLPCHRSDLVGNQLPACRTFYPNMYAPVLATCLFAAVLTFDGYPAGRLRYLSVNMLIHILLFSDCV